VTVDLVVVGAAASRGLEALLERPRVRNALLRLVEVPPSLRSRARRTRQSW
jgi:hypothetical protein